MPGDNIPESMGEDFSESVGEDISEQAGAIISESVGGFPRNQHAAQFGYFATRRFDRQNVAGRLHMVSLARAIEAPADTPSSYDLFFFDLDGLKWVNDTLGHRADSDMLQAFAAMLVGIFSKR